MKKINEKILKYLSGLMNDEEKNAFERDMEKSDKLQAEFNSVKNMLEDLTVSGVEADEKYFVNLIPKTRERIEKGIKRKSNKWIYYLAPALPVILAVVILYNLNNKNMRDNYLELAEAVVKNLDGNELANEYVFDLSQNPAYFTENVNGDFSIGLENEINKIPDAYLNMAYYSSAETYQSLDQLSDEDLKILLAELNDFKLQ